MSQSRLEEEKQAEEKFPSTYQRFPLTAYRGFFVHSFSFLLGTFQDVTFINPNFNKNCKRRVTIYCVHGTGDRSNAFNRIASRLLQPLKKDSLQNLLPDSIDKIHSLAFSGRIMGNGMDHYVEQLKSRIIKNEDTDVILIGHSRGGII